MSKNNSALKALTCVAMSLPGMVPLSSNAEAPPDKTTVSYRYTEYGEDDQVNRQTNADGETTSTSVQRYDIKVHQLLVSGAATSNTEYNVGVTTESMTGASPWFILPGATPDDAPVQIMSGATISENRTDANASVGFYTKSAKYGVGIATSNENDYSSVSASANTSLWLNNKNTTVDFTVAYSDDVIEPTGVGSSADFLNTRPERETKNSTSFAAGIAHNVNKNFLLGSSISYALYDGYLSDPYKLVSVGDELLGDSRPDSRAQTALNVQARHYFPAVKGALHADMRLFSSDWGTSSTTFNLAWYQNFGTWQVVPRLRYYSQSKADFYQNFFLEERADGNYSSDYRLSAFEAIAPRIKVSKAFEFATLHVLYEAYDSKGSGDNPLVDNNPGLVDFSFISAGFDIRW